MKQFTWLCALCIAPLFALGCGGEPQKASEKKPVVETSDPVIESGMPSEEDAALQPPADTTPGETGKEPNKEAGIDLDLENPEKPAKPEKPADEPAEEPAEKPAEKPAPEKEPE